jgi:dolichol kinase
MSGARAAEHTYTAEIVRKGIHLVSLSIPVVYAFIPKATALWILVPLTAAAVLFDVARHYFRPARELSHSVFGWIMRTHEKDTRRKRLTGASYVLLSASLCVFFFPKVVFLTAFSILIISDSAAALVGRRFGRRPFLTKSLEGSAAFLLSALVVVAVAPKVASIPAEYLIGGAAAVVGTVVEGAAVGLDDNLSIPISVGLTMWALYALLLPALDIFALG